MVVYGNIKQDFFEVNPEWEYLDSSIRLKNKFGDKIASSVRWCVYLLLDPFGPYYNNSNLIKRHALVLKYIKSEGVLEEGDFVLDIDNNKIISEKFGFVIEAYRTETMTRKERDFYDREMIYESSKRMVADLNDVSKRVKVEKELSTVSNNLEKLYTEIEEEYNKKVDVKRQRGSQQRGSMFR